MEQKFGYDGKHAGHLVRLLRMGKEILTTGEVIVKRPDAEELRAIRNGAWTYEELTKYTNSMERELNLLYESGKSPLPRSPDFNKLEQLCVDLIEEFYGTQIR